MRLPLTFCLLFFLFSEAASQTDLQNHSLVPVTAKYAVGKKSKGVNYRLQIFPSGDSLFINGFGINRLSRSLKKLKFNNSNVKKTRKDIETSAAHSLDSTYRLISDPTLKLGFKVLPKNDFERSKRNFLNGKRTSSYFSNQWINITAVPNTNSKDFSFKTSGFFKKHYEYTLDFLPAAYAWEFPALDSWLCEDADIRFFKLRKMQGYGLAKITYIPYYISERLNLRTNFDVYFAHNEVIPDDDALKKVIKYLEENNYSILNATLEGGCSIEGSLERNNFLQRERAKVLEKTLHRYNDELVKKDTVLYTDVVIQFREMIQRTEFAALDSLTDEALVNLINTGDSLRQALEPILARQRKASLNLVVAKRLTKPEQMEKMVSMLSRLSADLLSENNLSIQSEKRILGIFEKLFGYYADGFVSTDDLQGMINQSRYPQMVQVLLGYHILKLYETKNFRKHGVTTWEEFWEKNNVEHWLNKSRTALIEIYDYHPKGRPKYQRMLVDFQAYQYEFIAKGLIEANTLCEIPYPERPAFMGLILNQFAFLYEIVLKEDFASPSGKPLCVPSRPKPKIKKDSTLNVDIFLENILDEYGGKEIINYTDAGKARWKNKSFGVPPGSMYYYLLKQYYVKNDRSPLAHVGYTDNDANVTLNVFNLWHLTAINVEAWDPFENFFLDEDVQLTQLDKLINLLRRMDGNLCRPQVNNLYLAYYLKMLYYIELYGEPGNVQHTKYTETAFRFIRDYYRSRAKQIDTKLSMHILKQLNMFNRLPGINAGAYYGYEILSAIAKARLLNEEELKLYAHYLKLYHPQMKRVPMPYDKDKLRLLADESY